jgi:hypothetical protein
MGTLGKIAVVIVLGIIAIPVGCFGSAVVYEVWNTYTYRYRLTVEVETPDGLKSSSSVVEFSARPKAGWIPQTSGIAPSARGEAVFVDLGGGRNVIALLASGPKAEYFDYPYYVVPRHFKLGRNDLQELKTYSSLQGQWDLPSQDLPTLITFSDLSDPTTAQVLQPSEFEQRFGPGFQFKRAFVEMVSPGTWPFRSLGWPSSFAGEPVTRGIERKFPWWNGPFPWLKPIGGGAAIDTRTERDGFRWHKEHFKRES